MPPSMPPLSSAVDPARHDQHGSSRGSNPGPNGNRKGVSSWSSSSPPPSRPVGVNRRSSRPGGDGGDDRLRRSHVARGAVRRPDPTLSQSVPAVAPGIAGHPRRLRDRDRLAANRGAATTAPGKTRPSPQDTGGVPGGADDDGYDDDDGTDQMMVASTTQGQPMPMDGGGGMAAMMSSMLPSSPYGYYGGGVGPAAASMMMMPPYMMGAGAAGGGVGGPLAGLYQALYGIQNVVVSISQAVQLVSMNRQLLQQAWESMSQMVDHAVATFSELRTLELTGREQETEHDRQRRQRLRALRYALVFGGSWAAFKMVRHLLLLSKKPPRRVLQQQQLQQQYGHGASTADSYFPQTPYPANNHYAMSAASTLYGSGYPNGSYGMY